MMKNLSSNLFLLSLNTIIQIFFPLNFDFNIISIFMIQINQKMCQIDEPLLGISGQNHRFIAAAGGDGCLHRLFKWRNAEDDDDDGSEDEEEDSHHNDRASAEKMKKINFSSESVDCRNSENIPQEKANLQGEALAVTGQNPPPPSRASGARNRGTTGRPPPPHQHHPPQQLPSSTRRTMPKFLHTLCCCIRPDNYGKKNDSSNSTADGCDPRTSLPISQATKGGHGHQPSNALLPPIKSGGIRQRLAPRPETSSKGTQLVLGIGHNNNNNNATNNNNILPNLGAEQNKRQQEHHFLLQRVLPSDANRKCLIVDLDETLVHSSFKPVKNTDFVIPVEIDNVVHQVYVLKRPHTDHFLERIGSLFECVLFTASLAKYADPVADLLDKRRIFRTRLFRESCVFFEGNYVKDLERLGRDLRKVVIIDNSPASYAFHPDNAIAVRTWFDDPNDTELLDLLPMLEELAQADDIYRVLGTVPPHQQPRCLTPSEDLIQPPPMASSSPITQVADPSNGGGSQPQPWKRKVEAGGGTINNNNRFALGNSSNGRTTNRFGGIGNSNGSGEIKRPITMESVPPTTRR